MPIEQDYTCNALEVWGDDDGCPAKGYKLTAGRIMIL